MQTTGTRRYSINLNAFNWFLEIKKMHLLTQLISGDYYFLFGIFFYYDKLIFLNVWNVQGSL